MDQITDREWQRLLSQHHRYLTLQTALPDALIPESMEVEEAVNQDLQITLDCLSLDGWLDNEALIERPAHLQLVLPDNRQRLWQGLITDIRYRDIKGGLTRYRLVLGTWFSLLKQRRNTLIFQNTNALKIVSQVLDDYPQARSRYDVSQPLLERPICTQYRETDYEFLTRVLSEEGLSFYFEHDEKPKLDHEGRPAGGPRLVVFDRNAPLPRAEEPLPFTRISPTEAGDGICRFTERREIRSNAASTTRWHPDQLRGYSGRVVTPTEGGEAKLPLRQVFEAAPPLVFSSDAEAQLHADLLLEATRMDAHLFTGSGAIRHMQPATRYTLSKHALYRNQEFICLNVSHVAVNNLGAPTAGRIGNEGLEAGSYRNSFTAIPGNKRIVSQCLPRPLAAGVQTAKVMGHGEAKINSNRDHQVRVQFPWQSGENPLPGGYEGKGNAPGNAYSGTWVRVAEDAAGNNFGRHFVPRVGTEVLVGMANGDIDQPTILGQLYDGHKRPPFSAGRDSQANHCGTISGLSTRSLDGSPANQWMLDDTGNQLRHEVRSASADSRLALGYLIEQKGAERGAYSGQGFVDSTDGWGQVRAAQGLLISTTLRKDATSTQLDMHEAHGQLHAAIETAKRLDLAMQQANAGALTANPAQQDIYDRLDPAQAAHHPAQVNGQSATQPLGEQRDGGAPVPAFKDPHLVMETPSHLITTSPYSSATYATGHVHITSQKDTQLTAGNTLSGASSDSLHWFTAEGGAKVIAHNGDVTLQANDGALEIMADEDLVVTASDDSIELLAKEKIVLQSGTSTITLEGRNVTFSCEGKFTVNGQEHPIVGGTNSGVSLPVMPGSDAETHWVGVDYRDLETGQGISAADYEIQQRQGGLHEGRLKPRGDARHENVDPKEVAYVRYQEPDGANENEHPALGLLDGAAPAKPGNLP